MDTILLYLSYSCFVTLKAFRIVETYPLTNENKI